jgi:mannosyltransferase
MFSVLALLLLYRALDRPGAGRWVAYTAAIFALGLCSLVALTALAGHAAILVARRRAQILPWLAAALVTGVVLTPLIWWGLHQRPAQLHWVKPMTAGAVYTFPEYLVGSAEVGWLLIGVLLLAGFALSRPVVDMIMAAALPLALVCAVSFAGMSFWVNRYLLFVLLPAAIVAAAALTGRALTGRALAGPTLRPVLPVTFALVVFAAAAAPGQLAVRQPTVKNGSNYRALAATIEKQQQPGDDIVFEKGRTMRTGVEYYLRHDSNRPRDVLLEESAANTGTLIAKEYADPAVRLAGAARVWLVAYGRRADPATARPDLLKMLHGSYRRISVWQVKWGSMALYVKRS